MRHTSYWVEGYAVEANNRTGYKDTYNLIFKGDVFKFGRCCFFWNQLSATHRWDTSATVLKEDSRFIKGICVGNEPRSKWNSRFLPMKDRVNDCLMGTCSGLSWDLVGKPPGLPRRDTLVPILDIAPMGTTTTETAPGVSSATPAGEEPTSGDVEMS